MHASKNKCFICISTLNTSIQTVEGCAQKGNNNKLISQTVHFSCTIQHKSGFYSFA